jgi:hypothetical protein
VTAGSLTHIGPRTLNSRFWSKVYFWKYNFGWPQFVWILDSRLARAAVFIPLVGYLILFNDTVVSHLKFDRLAFSVFDLTPGARLKYIYAGLVYLGVANLVYRIFRPGVMKAGSDRLQYAEFGFRNFVFSDYVGMNDEIKYSSRGALTAHGKYEDKEWEGFVTVALGKGPEEDHFSDQNPDLATSRSNWSDAKQKYEDLLRNILSELYVRQTTGRRSLLSVAIALSTIGYVLIAVPGVDLFLTVVKVIASDVSQLI